MPYFVVAGKRAFIFKQPLIMRITTILFLFFTLNVTAKGFGQQKLNLNFKKTEVGVILTAIEKQSSYRFLYSNDLKSVNQKVSVTVQDAELEQVLKLIFANTELSYQLLENNLVVIKKSGVAATDAADKTITGTVTGDNGQPLSGVSVATKGNLKGTLTGTKGTFSITVPDEAVLVFSYVGYETQEVPVAGKAEINVVLVLSKKELDQVVVIGYGTQKKRDLTGSIAVVSGDAVAKMPSTNPISSLQGKVAGLTIVNSGRAGSSPTVRIRGVNSTNNADPLYVVDGIQQTNVDYLNQADIESIEILKDPSSISIYGLQGGNGVIIITTKRAKRGETRINFQSNVGVQKVIHQIDMVDAAGFKTLYNTQRANVGAAPFDFSRYDSTGANTNWQDQIFRTAIIASNSLSISNSTDKATTYINVGYSTQEGVEKYDKYEKYIARLNEEIRLNKNIKMGGEVTGFYFKQNPPPGAEIENRALWAVPNIPVQAAPGVYYATPSFQTQVPNPVSVIDGRNGNTINNGYRVTGNVFAEIRFLQNFTFKSAFFTDLNFGESRSYTPLPFQYVHLGEGATPTVTTYDSSARTGVYQGTGQFKTYQQDQTLTFDKNFKGGHHVTVLAGFSTLYHYSDYINGSRNDLSLNVPDNSIFWYLNIIQPTPTNPGSFSGGGEEDASASFLGRINYSFNNRYLLNLSFRRDGTSKFSPSHQWGNFGSIGAGWVVTDENFMKNVSWLDFLKLKFSWGTVGNGLNIGNYLSYPVLSNANVGVFGDNVYPAVTSSYIADPNLHWETVEGRDAGFELRAVRNRLSFDVDFYDRKTDDILTYITLPNDSRPYFTNLGTIDNRGVEITAGWKDNITKDLSYSINGNFSVNKNKVVSIGNNFDFEITNGINRTRSGYSIGYFYGYVQTGIYQSQTAIDKAPHIYAPLSQPGDISYLDLNGNDTISAADDRTYIGTPFPKYNFGVSVSFAYKGFDLQVDGQGVAGNMIYLKRRTYTFADLNYETNRLDAWHGEGTSSTEPILDPRRGNNSLFSTYWLEKGDYFRIRTLQLGYTFNPASPTNSVIKMLRLYVSGQNIATFTKATGFSPEVPIGSPVSGGADDNVYPLPAIYSFGLNVTF